MNQAELVVLIRRLVLTALANEGVRYLPCAISARHVHLSQKDVEALFGAGYKLTPQKSLSQPDQYACAETVTIKGPKGSIEKVRVLGPERKETQVEFSATDSFKLGVKAPVRLSGDLAGTSGITLVGPAGVAELDHGAIVAARHVHMADEEAKAYGLKNGDTVNLRKSGARPVVFEQVPVRCGKGHSLEVHLDTDEGNAAGIQNGDLLEIVIQGAVAADTAKGSAKDVQPTPKQMSIPKGTLVTEDLLADYAKQGANTIKLEKGAFITPLAKDKAWELRLNIEIGS